MSTSKGEESQSNSGDHYLFADGIFDFGGTLEYAFSILHMHKHKE